MFCVCLCMCVRVLKSQPLVLQNVTVFGDQAFKKTIKLK